MTTMMTPNTIVEDLVGQKCEGADNPHGSILRLDIGTLAPPPDDMAAQVHGWRHITVLSPWRITDAEEVIADWNSPGGPAGEIAAAVARLVGHRIIAAKCAGPAWDLELKWENRMQLFVFSDTDDQRDDAWFILGTDGLEIGVRPAYGTGAAWEIRKPSR